MARPITAADLPPDLARFVEAEIAAGRFESVEDVLRAGKEALEHEQQRRERKLAKLRAAIAEGDASPDFEGNPFASIRQKWLGTLPREATEAFAAFDRGEAVKMTPDELMDGIETELGLRRRA
jgi:putative addiction module CopG family antidote